MPEYSFDVGARFERAFGFVAQNAIPRVANVGLSGKLFYAGIETFNNGQVTGVAPEPKFLEPEQAKYKSRIGTPVFDQVTLSHPNLETPFTFELLPMIDFSRTKNIVVTEINGGDGEVIELIGNKPWSVRFRGLLVDMINHQLPLDQLRNLNNLFDFGKEKGETLKVDSELFNLMGISEIYLESFDPEFLEGFRDTISYTLTGKSHTPIEILLLE